MPRFNNYTNNYHHNMPAPTYNNSNNVNTKNTLNPLAYDDDEHNTMVPVYNDAMNHHAINAMNMNNLRMASHVSFENTPEAHEYNPNCKCHDCQHLLKTHTNYSTLDDYTALHLKYEAEQHQQFGRVPCVDGFYSEYGYVPVCLGNDEQTGEAIFETKYVQLTSSYLFHCHLHHMSHISPEVRNRSYNQYFKPLAVPAPRHQQHANKNTKHNNNNNNNTYNSNYNVNGFKQPAAYNNPVVAAAPVPSYHNNYSTTTNNAYYTESDINQAKRDVAFCGVATLGGI